MNVSLVIMRERDEDIDDLLKDIYLQTCPPEQIYLLSPQGAPFSGEPRVAVIESLTPHFVMNMKKVIAQCRGSIIVFLDSQVRLPSSNFLYFHQKAYQDEEVAAVAGRITTPDQEDPETMNARFYTSRFSWRHFFFNVSQRVQLDYVRRENFSVRKKDLERIHFSDENFAGQALLWELDLIQQFKLQNKKTLFEPQAVVTESVEGSGYDHSDPLFYQDMFQNAVYCFFKWYGWRGWYLLMHLKADQMVWPVRLREHQEQRYRKQHVFKGMYQGWRLFRQKKRKRFEKTAPEVTSVPGL